MGLTFRKYGDRLLVLLHSNQIAVGFFAAWFTMGSNANASKAMLKGAIEFAIDL